MNEKRVYLGDKCRLQQTGETSAKVATLEFLLFLKQMLKC